MSEQSLTATPVRFDTKIVVVLREGLAPWQELNMTVFLAGAVAAAHPDSIGERYADADGTDYLATFGQPAMVFAASAQELIRTLDRALSRDVTPSVFTEDLFGTGHDAANRAAVAAVARADLNLTGLAFRTGRAAADKITKGLRLHA